MADSCHTPGEGIPHLSRKDNKSIYHYKLLKEQNKVTVSGQQAQVLFYPDTLCGQTAIAMLKAQALRVQALKAGGLSLIHI